MQKGCIQLYYGDGKGKTTAAIGQIVRCVGHGFKVLVYQFLKEPNSGEVSVIKSLPGVEYIENEGPIPFMFNLTPEQQEFYKEKFQKKFDEVREKYFSGEYDLVVLDEVTYPINWKLLDETLLRRLLSREDDKPYFPEIVCTGREPQEWLVNCADYVTRMECVKHPFDRGIGAREGIEY